MGTISLRTWLVLVVAGTTAPLMALLLWWQADNVRQARLSETESNVVSELSQQNLKECEADPERYLEQRHRRPPHLEEEHAKRRRPDGDLGPPPGRPHEPPPRGEDFLLGGGPPPGRSPFAPRNGPPRGRPGPPWSIYDQNGDARTRGAPILDASTLDWIRTANNNQTNGLSSASSKRLPLGLLVRIADGENCRFVLVEHLPEQPALLRALLAPAVAIALAMAVLALALSLPISRLRQLTREVTDSAAAHYTESSLQGPALSSTARDEIGMLARAFSSAARLVHQHITNISERERILREHLANTTHDVMLPLTVLKAQLIKLRGQPSEDEQRALKLARQEVHYLGALISNLSAAAKLDRQQAELHLDTLSLSHLVERSVERQRTLAEELSVELNIGLPEKEVWVEADPTLVEQAFSNLVYNAIRYNKPGGHVAVVLEQADEYTFSLEVVDDGPGMSDEEMRLAMTRGFRGVVGTQRGQGSGLGLAIAQQVASVHGWKLTLHRSDYGGLVARIEMARAKPNHSPK